MGDVSIIGSGNMASAIGALALKGGNAVEIVGRDAAKAGALARALGDGATAGTWGAAPGGDIVILAVLFDSAVPWQGSAWIADDQRFCAKALNGAAPTAAAV
jgi:8-hydroxy-5-deazaflavin:NADPH oxidoreductase